MSVVVCSQCLYERSDFSLYEVGQKALEQGVIQEQGTPEEIFASSNTRVREFIGKMNA